MFMYHLSINREAFVKWSFTRSLITEEICDLNNASHYLLREAFGPKAFKTYRFMGGRDIGDFVSIYAYTELNLDDLCWNFSTFAPPDVMQVVNIDNLSCREVPNSIPRGSEIPFDVKVIPIRRQQETRKEIDVHTHNKMAGMTLIPKESYFEWMEERLGVGVLLDFERFHIVDSQRRTSLRKGKVISKKEISVSGVMKIIDPDDFQAILKRGIGRHKSYGFGMILLRQR